MVLELHVWGPAFGLPSIDAECIAAIAYFQRIVPHPQWVLIANYDTSVSPQHEFPALVDGTDVSTGFHNIVLYLRNHRSGAYDLDYNLTHQQQTDRAAFVSFIQSTAGPLIDLYLYVSSENYFNATTSAYTAILPAFVNYTIPPARRDLARARTAHLGLSSLDVGSAQEGYDAGSSGLSSEFEAAKKASGLPSDSRASQPRVLSLGRAKGVGGLLSSPIYAARFRLDALANNLLGPLSELLGKKDHLLEGDKPSSLDCLAFGYLALMFYAPVPQAWLKEALQSRFPRIVRYIGRMREELLGREDVKPTDVWSITSYNKNDPEIEARLQQLGMRLPWRPASRLNLLATVAGFMRELIGTIPLVSDYLHPHLTIHSTALQRRREVKSSLPSPLLINSLFGVSAACAAGVIGLAVHHRRSPRHGELVFETLRPAFSGFQGYESAPNIFDVLGGKGAR